MLDGLYNQCKEEEMYGYSNPNESLDCSQLTSDLYTTLINDKTKSINHLSGSGSPFKDEKFPNCESYVNHDFAFKTSQDYIANNYENITNCKLNDKCKITNKQQDTCLPKCFETNLSPTATCAVGCSVDYKNKHDLSKMQMMCNQKSNEEECTSDKRCYYDYDIGHCDAKDCPYNLDSIQTYNFNKDEVDDFCVKQCTNYECSGLANEECENSTECNLNSIVVPYCENNYTYPVMNVNVNPFDNNYTV